MSERFFLQFGVQKCYISCEKYI